MISPAAAGVRIVVASRPVDFRNYAERRIMRSPGQSAARPLDFPNAALRIIFGALLAVEHRQELVRRAEASSPEVRRRGGCQGLELF
jgi:hypothetical protein